MFSLFFSLSPQLASFCALRTYSEPLQLFLNSVVLFCFVKIFSGVDNIIRPGGLKFWVIASLGTGYLTLTKSFFYIYPLWLAFFSIIYCRFIVKNNCPLKTIAKLFVIFLFFSYLLPFLWLVSIQKKDNYQFTAERFSTNILIQAYSTEWGHDVAFKWSVFQISGNLGKFFFPADAKIINGVEGELTTKSFSFVKRADKMKDSGQTLTELSIREWGRLVKNHPFRYVLYYCVNGLNDLLLEGVYPDIYPEQKSTLLRYVYLINALLLHFLYSMFIWSVIIGGIFVYMIRYKTKLLSQLTLKRAIIVFSLGYFLFFAFHFHTELRYLYPFYINIYLLFTLSCEFLKKSAQRPNIS